MNIFQKIFGEIIVDPFALKLTQEEIMKLSEIRKHHNDPKVKLRANIVLEKFRRKSRTAITEICNAFDLPEWTVSGIIRSYKEFGIEGLVPSAREDY